MNEQNLKKYFWLFLNLCMVGLVVLIFAVGIPGGRRILDSIAPVRAITVSAEGRSNAAPDIAQSSFSVVSRGTNPTTIAAENNDKISAAIEELKRQGVEAKDIKTTGYNLNPVYAYEDKTGVSRISGYELVQTVTVKIRDLSKVNSIIGALAPLGINQIGGVSFTLDDPDKARSEARAEAFRKAREKAEVMASQNGVRIGRLINFSENGGGVMPYYYAKDLRQESAVSNGGGAPSIEPGQEEVNVSVNVTYELK
jgi:uncharacterized protein